MWHVDHEIEAFFERIKNERGKPSDTPTPSEEAPMMKNAMTAGMRR